jgi:hypothetical protein
MTLTPQSFLRHFFDKIRERGDGCWIWKGATSGRPPRITYGIVFKNKTRIRAHRLSYAMFRAAIPKLMTIDHLCREPLCVNPEHLEVVSNRENILRGFGPSAMNARKSRCWRGHLLSGRNVRMTRNPKRYPARVCRKCHQIMKRLARIRRAAS